MADFYRILKYILHLPEKGRGVQKRKYAYAK